MVQAAKLLDLNESIPPREMSVRLRDERLEVGLRGFKGFLPRAYHGVSVELHIVTDRGPRDVRGRLSFLVASSDGCLKIDLRGAWFKFTFEPTRAEELLLVLMWDDRMWSNVEWLDLDSGQGPLRLKNDFFRAPASADAP